MKRFLKKEICLHCLCLKGCEDLSEEFRNQFIQFTKIFKTNCVACCVQSCNFGLFWDSTERFFEAPTLDQAPVNFFLISNSVNDGNFHTKYST